MGNPGGGPNFTTSDTIADLSTSSGILPSANGGTGINNAGSLTNASNTTITGGGTIALGGFTATIPATGTTALRGSANTFTALNTFNGGVAVKTVSKVFGDSPYSVASTDFLILVDTSGGAFTANLPAAASNAGRILIVKKISSDANAATIDGNASELVDGLTTQDIVAQYEALMMICDGTGWHIV